MPTTRSIVTTSYCLIASFFILPFLPSIVSEYFQINFLYQQDCIAPLLAVITLAYYLLKNYTQVIKINCLQLYLLGFMLVIMLQLVRLPSYQSYSYQLIACLGLASCLSFTLTNQKFNFECLFTIIAKAILIGAYIQCLLSSLQLVHISLDLIPLTYYPYTTNNLIEFKYNILPYTDTRIVGGIYQPNLLANYLTWAIFANLYLLKFNSLRSKLYFIVNLVLFSLFISLSLSRIGVAYALFMLIYALLISKQQRNYAKYLAGSGLILLLAIILTSKGYLDFFYNLNNHPLTSKLTTNLASEPLAHSNGNRLMATWETIKQLLSGNLTTSYASDNQRIVLWLKGLAMFTHNPLLGVGWGYFASNLFSTKLANLASGLPEYALPLNAHNLFIHLLATTGILGTGVVIALIIYVYKQLIKLPIQPQILCLGIVSINLIHSQVEYPLFYTSFLFAVIVLLSLSCAMISAPSSINLPAKAKNFILGIIILVSSWQLYVGITNFLILGQFKPVANYSSSNFIHNSYQKYLIGANPLWQYYADADLVEKLTFSQITAQNQTMFAIVYNTTQKVVAFTPFPSYMLKLAIMEQMLGHNLVAQQLIEQTLHNYPQFKLTITTILHNATMNNLPLQQQLLGYVK
jgi:hypothetical protein